MQGIYKMKRMLLALAMSATPACATTHAGGSVEMLAATLVGVPAGIGILVVTPEINGKSEGSVEGGVALGVVMVGAAVLFMHGMYVTLQPKGSSDER